jgi:regulator of protease activity HflC (stomatin/prohibitin superfamily)
MFITILCGIIALAGIAILVLGPKYSVRNPAWSSYGSGNEPKYLERSARWTGPVAIGVALVFFALFSWTQIGAKNVGVLTTFGKPSERTLSPGFHFTWPWQETTEIDGSVQSKEYEGDSCIYVKIGDGSRSCVTTTINWRITPENAYIVYSDYRDDDDYDNPVDAYWGKVLSKQFKAAIQSVFADYNPVAGLETIGGENKATDLSFAPDLPVYEERMREQMNERLGDDPLAEILSISMSYFSFSESTQATIDAFTKAVGETRVAAQREETAEAEARANEALSDSISNDPNVLVSKCLDILNDAMESGYALPAGFSCWGAGNSVVIPGAPK